MDKYQIETIIRPVIREHYAFDKITSKNIRKALELIEKHYDVQEGLYTAEIIDDKTILLADIPALPECEESHDINGSETCMNVGCESDNFIRIITPFDVIDLSGDIAYKTIKFCDNDRGFPSLTEEIDVSTLTIDEMKVEEGDYIDFQTLLEEMTFAKAQNYKL